MTIKEKEKAFRLHLLEEEKARSTIALYMTSVRQFLDFAGDAPVDKYLTMAYKEELMERYTAATVNSRTTVTTSQNLSRRFVKKLQRKSS